jgi:serine phosphatase RsbU (regulator of sigma subunit)
MFRLKNFIFFFILLCLKNQAQFLDKTYYLVDSIEKKETNKNDFIFIESNLKKYKLANSDTLKLNLISQIIENVNDETIWPKYNQLLYSRASNLATNEKDPFLKNRYLAAKALAINNFGFYIQNYTQKPEKAFQYYKDAAELQKKINDKKGLVVTNNNIANMLYNNGKIVEALDIYHETIKIQEELKNVSGLTPLLNNIAETYIFIGDSSKAYIYLKRALASAIQSGDKRIIAQELQNIGVLASHRGQKDYALECIKKALIIREEIGDVNGICKSKLNLATILLKDKEYISAKNYLKEVESYVSETDNLNIKYLFHSCYAMYYNETNDLKNAEYHYEQALKYTQINKAIQDESKIIASLIKLYSKNKNDAKELELLRRNNEINKIINGSEIKRNAIRKNYEFEYSKKEQDYKIEQAIKDEKSKSEKRKQKFITYGISFILIFTLIFSFFIYKAFKISKQKNIIISNQKQEVEKQKYLIEEKQKEIVDSINYAKRIQNTLLANEEVITKNLKAHFIFFKPKDIVSGDFYWANELTTNDKDLFFLAVCDSTGHGVPGAFMSLLNTNFLNEAINEKQIFEPHKVFNYVRDRLINSISKENQKDGFDGILICIDKLNNCITYSAANNAPILINNKKEIIKLPFDKMPVGKGEKGIEFNQYTLNYQKGDFLYLYTDGFADQFGGQKTSATGGPFGQGKKFKYKPLNDLLSTLNDFPVNKRSDILDTEFQKWKGELDQVDDVCIIGFQL